MQLLSTEFLSTYPNMPEHMNELGQFVFYRTYSRWLPQLNRRETWKEAVARAVNYNVSITIDQFANNNLKPPMPEIIKEAEMLFDNIFNLRQFLSGRTHWVGGAESKVADKFPLANFNCAFIDITKWDDLCDMFYLLLIGTGCGFKCTKENASKLAAVRTDWSLIHSKFNPLPPEERIEFTKINVMENGYAKIYIGDSKEGWVEALRCFLTLITSESFNHIKTIKLSYNSIRPQGERLKTFGGTASGHESLKEMFIGIEKVLRNQLDHTLEPLEILCHKDKCDIAKGEVQECHTCSPWRKVRPIHILDIGNLIGNNVVVGGVRRTAEIFLCDADDWECIFAKYGINGIWDEVKHAEIIMAIGEMFGTAPNWLIDMDTNNPNIRPLYHRRMSNNSIAFTEKPSKKFLDLVFKIMQTEGEPGFINLEAANQRRPNCNGVNPCAEILLDSYGVCNLTTVNVTQFINEIFDLETNEVIYELDLPNLCIAQALSTRAGIRMTCLDLELPKWDVIHKRDRLIGTSLTGWKDAMDILGYDEDEEIQLLNILYSVVNDEATRYSYILRIPTPLLTTTIKPEGTLSQVAGGVSSGLHVSHSPYYIRRIRINASDPLVKVAEELNWTINPEVGTPGDTYKEQMQNARTLVIDFPIKSGAKKTRNEQSVIEQFNNYFNFQTYYTSHNSSNTISIKPDEWDTARDVVWENWNDFIGVSFLAYDGGSYPLSPYEEITEEEYNTLKSKIKPFNPDLLLKYEHEKSLATEDGIESCESGVCPVR